MFSFKSKVPLAGLTSFTVAGVFLASTSLAANLSPELRDLVAKAKSDGKLHMSWSSSTLGGAAGAKKFQAGINKMFNTDLKFSFSPGRSMAGMSAKIRAEVAAGQPATSDIYIGTAPFVLPLLKRKVLIKHPWTKYLPVRIPSDISEGGGAVLRIATDAQGVTYNSKLIPTKKKPTKLTDFLDPVWKGKIASTPYAAGFDTLSAHNVWGPAKTIDFVKKLATQIRGLIRCGEGERIATGEIIALVMDCNGQSSRLWKDKGASIDQMLPIDAAIKRHFYLGVPTNSTHKAAAALYAVFLATKEGQKLVWETWKVDADVFPESNIRKRIVAM